MQRAARNWIWLGAILAGLAVACGAFAAHGLEKPLMDIYGDQTKTVMGVTVPAASKYLGDFKTAADYQMYHALGLLAVGLLIGFAPSRSANIAGWCFLGGIVLFSGSLYALVLSGYTKLGMITPIGGVLFLIGWGAFAVAAGARLNAATSD